MVKADNVRTTRRLGRKPANAGKTYPPEILTESEVDALREACSPKASTGIRNRALITAMYRAGLRVSEALALLPRDIDSGAGTLAVLRGGNRRIVSLDPGAFAAVARWLDRRAELGCDGRNRVFCTLGGEALKAAYVRALLPRLAAKAGVARRVHAHGLRHTHAAELARDGTPLDVLQAQLGHASPATTGRYLRHLATTRRVRAPEPRVWTPEED